MTQQGRRKISYTSINSRHLCITAHFITDVQHESPKSARTELSMFRK